MRNYTLNLFKLNNWMAVNFSYKLVDFNLRAVEGQEDRFNKQLQKIALKVSSLSGGPSAVVKRNGRFYVAIPSENSFEETTVNVVPHNVKVTLLPEVQQVNASNINDENIDVVLKFLDFAIRKHLSKNHNLWKLNASEFFSKKPISGPNGSVIQIYEGFAYKLIRLHDGGLYICLDLSTKYIDKNYFSHYVNPKNVQSIGNRFRGRRFIYLNGDNWYATELVGFGDPVKDHEITDKDGSSISVYDYILKYANGRRQDIQRVLNPSDLTMMYKYPGRSMEPHAGACALAKMVYSPKDKEVQALHSFSIKDPTTRFESIEHYIKEFFQNIRFNGITLLVSKEAVTENIKNFNLPPLRYNKNKILSPGNPLREYGAQRKRFLVNQGVLSQTFFDEQFLVVPESMDRKLIEAIERNLEYQIKKLAQNFQKFKIIRYAVKPNQPATFQVQEIERILAKNNALNGFALFILPDLTSDSRKSIKVFHDCLKNKFYPNLKVQCASGFKLQSFFERFVAPQNKEMTEFKVPENMKPKFASYLLNLVLEHLIVNRKWSYALAKNLHYDIYIGIDVHDRHAGFSFFFKNGEHIFFFPVQVPLKNRSQRAEKLKAKLLVEIILEKLKVFIPQYCPQPNGIVIIRDGRSFGEETKAIKQVIAALGEAGLVDKAKIRFGVVDLHKQSSLPLRIATQTNGHNKLENPTAGAYKMIGGKEAFIFNTGFPFQIRGTAKPLNLSLRDGDVDFLQVMEDVFCQSMLAFSAPDRSNSLPITIKLIDTLLEPLSEMPEDVGEEEEEFEEISAEENL